MKGWSWLKDYFDLNRRERRATGILLSGILLLLVFQYTARYFFRPAATIAPARLKQMMDSIDAARRNDSIKPLAAQVQLFAFDPNTVSEDSLLQLGLDARVAEHLVRYRQKGGVFHRAEDVRKIYGLEETDYQRLLPYVKIQAAAATARQVDLNTADSATLVRLYDIGPVFAQRIIRYRARLGGFASREQLKEVPGIDQEHYLQIAPQVKANAVECRKIAINTAKIDEMVHHPYFKDLAKAIVHYREQHGPYHSADDLLRIKIISKEQLSRLMPYVALP